MFRTMPEDIRRYIDKYEERAAREGIEPPADTEAVGRLYALYAELVLEGAGADLAVLHLMCEL